MCERALAAVDGLAMLLLVNVVARTVALKPSVKRTLQELWKNEEPAHKSSQAWQAAKDAWRRAACDSAATATAAYRIASSVHALP